MRRFSIVAFLSLGLLVSLVSGQTIQQARASVQSDLENSIEELGQLRTKIENEKIPLAQKVSELERQAIRKRKELDRKLSLRDNRDASLLQLKEEVHENENQLDLSLRLLKDYAQSWRQTSPSAEQRLWNEQIADSLGRADGGRTNDLKAFLEIASLSTVAIEKNSGGMIFQGNAIIPPEGARESGTFLSLGPVLVFAGKNGTSGFIERSFSSENDSQTELTTDSIARPEPSRLLPTSESTADLITQALQAESGGMITLPLDPSMGKALIMEGGELTVLEELQKGGIWIYPIVFFAALSLLIAIFKAYQILRISSPKRAPSLNRSYQGPFEALRKTAKGYQGKQYEILEEILYETIIDFQVKLEKALPLIAVTAATAPLLGLLGTVTGMIDVFRQITNFANPENSELARGISEALVTTKFGLITAIPSLIVHALLSRRVQGLVSGMESFAARLVHLKRNTSPDEAKEEESGLDS
jgi:biopolymer transport protein ExbB